jgi:Rhs element Vgr protein
MTGSLTSQIPGTRPATDVVTRKVFINGVELSNSVLLNQITANISFNKVAGAKITFLDGSPSERDFPLSNDNRFKPGNTIRVQLGYHGEVETIFEGIIIKHAVKVYSRGISLLLIEAKDKAIKLTTSRKSKYYIDKTDKTVMEELATAGRLQHEVQNITYTHKQLVQFNCTDWDFIVTRAEANGMLVLTDNGKLVIKEPATGTSQLTATYGRNIWEFEAEMDARKVKHGIISQSWNYSSQELEESEEGTAEFSGNGNISTDDLGNVLGAEVKLRHSGNLSATQLQDWSNAHAMRNHISRSIGRVRVEGTAEVKPGTTITLEGVGDRFNGDVFVTGVLHHYEGLWQTDIQFGWRDDWFYKKEDVMEKPSSGLLPGVNGLQIGVVKDINDDQDGGQYRVKVHVPTFTGNEGIWARVSAIDAGPDRGVYFRPKQGDEVVLGFLNDDPRDAIILGYLHSKDSKRSPLPVEDGAIQHGFVTKEGIKVIFDDTNKRLTLRVPSGTGEKSLIMNTSSNAFEMKDENQNTIKMDSQGITITAGSGNVVISGTQVRIN